MVSPFILGSFSFSLTDQIYYIKLKSRLFVCTFWHANISAVSARIETGLARNESCVFEDHKVYAYKPIVPTVN